MQCLRCKHENPREQKFCGACGTSLTAPSGPPAPSYAEITSAMSEALEQQKATAELLQARNRELAEAQEQQAATSAILRVIATSPTDVQPVFAAVLRSAARLCDAFDASIFQVDGGRLRLVAHEGPIPSIPLGEFPLRGTSVGRAVLDRRTIHVADMQAEVDEYPEASAFARSYGHRTTLSVPLLRGAEAIGAIGIRRTEVRPFTDRQIELLETFAAQAVIAIENVRLFNETKETLEQQTATGEILRVIASSPTDTQPVFQSIAEASAQLCDAGFSFVHRSDGELIHFVANYNVPPEVLAVYQRMYPRPPSRESLTARAILDRTVIHVVDAQEDPDVPEASRNFARLSGTRSGLVVPMLHDGRPVGCISVVRPEARPYTGRQISLLQTFAAQAVIAIENVRLFNETKEALEQQTATADILRVISGSPTDVQPVFDSIARSAAQLCEGNAGAVVRYDGELAHLVAAYDVAPERLKILVSRYPTRVSRAFAMTRAIVDRAVVHIPDTRQDSDYDQEYVSRTGAPQSLVAVPLLREGRPIGAIAVARLRVGPFSENQIRLLQTFAEQAVIAIENVRLFQELESRNRDLTDALERETATGGILRAIATSPTNPSQVFEAILDSTLRLCGATIGAVLRSDGRLVSIAAISGRAAFLDAVMAAFPRQLTDPGLATRAVREGVTVHVPDVLEDPSSVHEIDEASGHRAELYAPMLREGRCIGAICIARDAPGLFSETQVALVHTLADQAAIAVENVRLFKELEARNRELTESLEQQTATSEILRVIASSPTDLQPVIEAVVENAARVCGATDSEIWLLEGEHLRPVARRGSLRRPVAIGEPVRVNRGLVGGRAVRDRQTIHVADVLAAEAEFPEAVSRVRQSGATTRTMLATPLLREGTPLGVIFIDRGPEPNPFSAKQIALLETFANQAVIAIENVRLFNETKEALEQQTATAEILRVISSSPTAIQPVLDAVAENAARVCGADDAIILRLDGDVMHTVAGVGPVPRLTPEERYPVEGTVVGRAVTERRTMHIHDMAAESEAEFPVAKARQRAIGIRTVLATPLLRQGVPIGAIGIRRLEVRPFSDKQVKLLETFAAQAVIAIENVRLFTELEARTQDLTRSVGELRALGDVGRALSSTLDLDTVLQTIVTRASQLAGTDACSVFEYDEATEAFHLRATHNLDEAVVALARRTPIRKGEGTLGRMAVTRQPVQIPDIAAENVYRGPLRDILLRTGTRALLAIPLLREDELIGGLTVNRKTPGAFPPEVIELLRTFATQSALAIQNARLFLEIADKSRQLEAASRHKSEFLANMSHELRTPLNAILGFSEVLAERMFGEINAKQAEYLEDILSSGRHLLSLINDILDLSKVEAGRLELELGRFHLPTALDNALTLVRERATRHGITLTQTVDAAVGNIVADERKVKQILVNLLSNAVKFTPEGGRVDLTATAAEGDVTIAVRDTGVGIAPEDQAAIFEEFRQVGRDDARKQEGTGLGLTLAKKFAELHGGRIWVQSHVGQGSTFTFTLPVQPDGRSSSDHGGGAPLRP